LKTGILRLSLTLSLAIALLLLRPKLASKRTAREA
jgi:hypothetical protein